MVHLPLWFLSAACAADASNPFAAMTYDAARASFQTRLTVHTAAPQEGGFTSAVPGTHLVEYAHDPRLVALLSDGGDAAAPRPAVLVLHGGFAEDGSDWTTLAAPFVAAGYRVMMPILRGENYQLGDYSLFYGEVDDVATAAAFLAKQPGVDPDRLFITGHSVGGTLAMLGAMRYDHFRAGTSFSGAADVGSWLSGQPWIAPFEITTAEVAIRSPSSFPSSFRCPFRILYGSKEAGWEEPGSGALAQAARAAGRDVKVGVYPGDHFGALPGEIQATLAFFKEQGGL